MSRMVTQNDPNLRGVWVRSLECVNSWLISLHQGCSLLKWASLWAISLGVYFIGGRVCLRSVSNSCRTIRHNFIMLLSVVKRNSSCQTNLKPFSSSSIFLTNCLRFFSKTLLYQSGGIPTRLHENEEMKRLARVLTGNVRTRNVAFRKI